MRRLSILLLLIVGCSACGEPEEEGIPQDILNGPATPQNVSRSGTPSLDAGQHLKWKIRKRKGYRYKFSVDVQQGDMDWYIHWNEQFKPVNRTFSTKGKFPKVIEIEPKEDGLFWLILWAPKEDSVAEVAIDEKPPCVNACTPHGSDCGLPCNADVAQYNCPLTENQLEQEEGWNNTTASDSNKFEHRGNCYRKNESNGGAQQCCYTDGVDNGTGSYDLVKSSQVIGKSHCQCDVIPLCGCMAQSGLSDACDECISEFPANICNAEGLDFLFCDRAKKSDFDWCGIIGNKNTCFDRP